ncbi:hypothetical protein GT030_09410 [Streptomyces sp. SID1328]|uniref:ATP-binding protein n=1 Tax=Streptomyces sp. SID1328 TaxID=2690250 RepID=UPI00136B5AE6|nr:ATP-binding protein [Streptomyces sp. SID1328]MYV39085.1 hypothetical protein [Streptomyces sp. SID1328]
MTVAKPNAIGAPGYTAELPCVRESASHARDLVSNALAAWGMDDDMADCGRIIVTELLANAVEHTETPVSKITIERRSNGAVCIGVSDRSHGVPHLKTAALNAESGRGTRKRPAARSAANAGSCHRPLSARFLAVLPTPTPLGRVECDDVSWALGFQRGPPLKRRLPADITRDGDWLGCLPSA